MTDWPTYATPEEAALAGWVHTPAAAARVVEVRPHPDSDQAVWVVLRLGVSPTGFQDQDVVTCERQPDGSWVDLGSAGAESAP